MSTRQSFSAALPSSANDTGDESALTADAVHQPSQPSSGDGNVNFPVDTAELAKLLADGQWGDVAEPFPAVADTNSYDGHVALALDPGMLPEMDMALDLLTSSHDLFSVPALDVSSGSDDISSS